MKTALDHGRLTRLGIATPQANPTFESEIKRLSPTTVDCITMRLTSPHKTPEKRITEYLINLPELIKSQYAGLKVDALIYGCTGSSYLVDQEDEKEIIKRASSVLGGSPVITAASAMVDWLKKNNTQTIVMLSPYPEWLQKHATRFWSKQNMDIKMVEQVEIEGEDTHGIYELTSEDALPLLEKAFQHDVDAIVISGTGMPTLRLIEKGQKLGKKIISSNYAAALQGLSCLGKKPQAIEGIF